MTSGGPPVPGSAPWFRSRMASRPVVGIWSLMNSPVAMDVISRAGLDFVVIDLEHGASTTQDAWTLASVARAGGITPVLRVPSLSQRFIQQALDWGATGLKVPNISCAEDVARFEACVRYPPDGIRGLSPFVPNAGYLAANTATFCATRREEELYILQIETRAGLESADAIFAADIHVLFVGLYDLSRSLGVAPESAVLDRCLADLSERARAAGKVLGTIASSEAQLRRHLDLGVGYVTYLADTHILLDALGAIRRFL